MLNSTAKILEQLDIEFSTRGGKRDGAGRPRAQGRRNAEHHPRERHSRHHPVHVTMRAREGLPPLREQVITTEVMKRIREANASKKLKDAFRIVHFSVQDDHVHLIIEARDGVALSRGAQGLAIRLARRVNQLLGIRGKFWGDRFHSRELTAPRAVRNAIVYVLMNAKKHGYAITGIDVLSSAPWFVDGFVHRLEPRAEPPPVRNAATWLASVGWRRHGLLRASERPR